MPVGNAPQFRGVEDTVEAYRNAKIPAYAVCYAKDINFRYMGDDSSIGAALLTQWLTKLKEHGTQAIYQLRLYEDLNGKTIKSNTPCDMAFKFVLNERDGYNLPVKSDSMVSNSDLIRILTENAELKAENAILLMKVEQDEDEDEKPDAVPQKSIGEIMIEKFAPTLTVIGERIADMIVPPATPARVSGITIETGNIDEERIIEQSIRRLRNTIPDNPGIASVLMKLADLAEKQPGSFNFYMETLLKMRF